MGFQENKRGEANMSRRYLHFSLLIMMALVLVWTGCRAPSATTTATATSAATTTATTKVTTTATTTVRPGPSGTVTIAMENLGDEVWDLSRTSLPVFVGPVTASITDNLVSLSATGEVLPSLAESWTDLPGGLGWTFKLRQGVKFHNGDTMKSVDVKFSLEKIAANATSTQGRDLARLVQAIETPDDYTVIVRLKAYDAVLLSRISYNCGVMPAAYYNSVGPQGYASKPIGTGPFKFVSWEPKQRIELQANEDYWNKNAIPRVKTVILKFAPDLSTRMAMLKTGEADIIDAVSGKSIDELKTTPKLSVVTIPGAYLNGLTLLDTVLEAPSPLKNIKVRQAISLAINRQALVDTVFRGMGRPIAIDWNPYMEGYDPTWKADPYDPQRAKQLLAEAGYAGGFTIDLNAPQASYAEIAEPLVAMLADIGVKANLKWFDPGTYYAKIGGKALTGMAVFPFVAGYYNPAYLVPLYRTGKDFVMSNNSDLTLDAMLAKYSSQLLPAAERIALARQIGNYIIANYTRVFINSVDTVIGLGPRVSYTPNQAFSFLGGFESIVLK